MKFFITSAQCRAARALLGWGQPELARKSGLHVQTICAFEKDIGTPTRKTLTRLAAALEKGGVDFHAHDGVGRKVSPITSYDGAEGFVAFMQDVLETSLKSEGENCIFNVDESWWQKYMPPEQAQNYNKLMNAHYPKVVRKVMIREGDYNFFESETTRYRWVPKDMFSPNSFYSYGNKLGLFIFDHDNVRITVLEDTHFVRSYNALFNMAWEKAAIAIPPKKHKKTGR